MRSQPTKSQPNRNKSQALFSPSTRYRDPVLAPSLFHGESQSNARGSRVLLFVREHRREGGRAGAISDQE